MIIPVKLWSARRPFPAADHFQNRPTQAEPDLRAGCARIRRHPTCPEVRFHRRAYHGTDVMPRALAAAMAAL